MDLFSLGDLYISDFLADGEQPRADPAELRLVMDDDTGLVHLAEQPDPKLMWGRYWYHSGTNESMRRELRSIVDSVYQVADLDQTGGPWVDIACNDGTLFEEEQSVWTGGPWRVGVDPADDSFAEQARRHCEGHYQQPFTSEVADAIVSEYGHAQVVTCIAMFYDLLDPTDFLAGVHNLLDRDGLFVLQLSYTPLMLQQLAFDSICHEHARYYTLTTLRYTLDTAGFEIVDCQLNDTNAGSMRVYAMRHDADPTRFGTQPHRQVAAYRLRALLNQETCNGMNTSVVWQTFWRRLLKLSHEVHDWIVDVRNDGASVAAYGASTKGNTLLQFFGLDHTLIDCIAERQPGKIGLHTVGTDIPIVSEDEWRAARPDYTLMLPWHFVGSFVEREADYLAAGGRFVVPCPTLQVIGDD